MVVSTTIRWRLPETSALLPTPIEGFLITIKELNYQRKDYTQNKTNTWVFEAKLAKSINQITSNYHQVEFFLNSHKLFNFGKKYKIEVALLPLVLGGVTNQIRLIPQNVENPKQCLATKETAELAKYWNLKILSVHVMIVQAAVNISFISAPKSLCIDRYSIQLHIKDNPIIIEYIVNKTEDVVQHQLLEGLPREQYITVKVVPYSYPNERCPCTFCNCIMTKSYPFILPLLKREKNMASTQHPAIITDEYGMAFLGLFIVLIILLAGFSLITLACVMKRKKDEKQSKVYLHHDLLDRKLLEPSQKFRVLLVTSIGSEEELNFVDELALLLSQYSSISLKYHRFDELDLEQNKHIWTVKHIADCDKIILVHTRHRPINKTDDLLYSIQNILSLRDDRVILVKLHRNAVVFNVFQETIYLFPRDIQYFCTHLLLKYDNQWISLEEKALNMYNKQPTTIPESRLTELVQKLLASNSKASDQMSLADIEEEAEMEDMPSPAAEHSALHAFKTSQPASPMDSGYQSKSSSM
ncbi:unnamed protein product [Auanema sp. JU1783]|nr:unnamed protein product [Auanema sp. JU1783]